MCYNMVILLPAESIMLKEKRIFQNIIYKKHTRTAALLAACFLLPAILLLLVYYSYGIAPFGDKSLLIMDMSAQYSEFFCGLKHIGAQNGGVLFSWSKVFGSNYAGVFAYYVSSPLSLLTLLCPNEYMPVGLFWLTILKIGLCGLTFGILLCKMHARIPSQSKFTQNRIYIIAFAVFYALMSYNIVYSMSLMWLDAVIWLPIIVLGIEKIVSGGKPYLLFASLTALFLSTYYISYMVGIFACLYLVFALVRRIDAMGSKAVFLTLLKFAGSAVSAACMGAWLLLPTLYSLFEGKITGSFFSDAEGINYEPAQIFKKFFLGTYDGITNSGTPFLYCGIIIAALYFAYFFTKTVTKKEKIITFSITLFILVSTYNTPLDTMWHVFQKPNWFPYRYFFIFAFFVIFTAARAFMRIREIPHAVFAVFFVITGAFYAYVFQMPKNGVGDVQKSLTLKALVTAVILITALILLCRLKHTHTAYAALAVCVVLIFSASWEMYQNARLLTEGLDHAHRYESYEKYVEYKKLTQELVSYAKEQSDGEFYRMGSGFQRNFNEAIGLGYAGLSHYSSSYNSSINSFLTKAGFAQVYFWSSYAGSTTVTDSLFSVKYVMSDPEISRLDDQGRVIAWSKAPYTHYKEAGTAETAVLYENPYVLPPCIAVSSRIKDFEWLGNAVESQNSLLDHMLDGNMAFSGTSYFMKMTEDSEGAVTLFERGNTLEYVITVPKTGPLYAVFPTNGNNTAAIQINDAYETKLYTGETDCVQFLGSYEAGESVKITINAYSHLNRSGNAFYQLDIEAFEQAVDKLRENAIAIEAWSSGYIKGTVNASENGAMFTSLVYDESWNVRIDGKKAETWALKDGLLCFDITAGTHEIEIEYNVPGFAAGTAVTLCFITGAAAYSIIRYIFARRKAVC